MLKTKISLFHLSPIVLSVLILLSACGRSAFTPSPPASSGEKPDKVQIELMTVDNMKHSITVTDHERVQRLYDMLYSLSLMPENQSCTADMGPIYGMVFTQGEKTLVTARAEHYGCHVVAIHGENKDRQATQEFWKALDEAMTMAMPPAHPQQLAVVHTSQLGHQPEIALLTDTARVQKLYNALIQLPLVPLQDRLGDPPAPEYRLNFQDEKQQNIFSVFSPADKMISLNGDDKSRGGVYRTDPQFMQLFNDTIAAAIFKPTQPDQLELSTIGRQQSSKETITAIALMQKLYTKTFTLPTREPQRDCPSGADKQQGKGTFYSLSFSQQHLQVLNLEVYEGSCKRVAISSMEKELQPDQEFWTTFHQLIRARV